MKKKTLETGNSLHRGPRWGSWRRFVYWDFLREREMEGSGNGTSLIKLIWDHFLDPDYFINLSLGAIWNFCEGAKLP